MFHPEHSTGTMPQYGKPCLLDGNKYHNHSRNSCRLCKMIRSRKYRETPKGKDYEKNRNSSLKGTLQEKAKRKVYIAVRAGRLPRIQNLNCLDCFRKAEVYDHRNYFKPLEVEPVCRICNFKRGPAISSQ